MRAARKLRNRRRVQKWADKAYKKAHLGTRWKANPFGGSSHAKGIVVEKLGIEAKQVGCDSSSVYVQCGDGIDAFTLHYICLLFCQRSMPCAWGLSSGI